MSDVNIKDRYINAQDSYVCSWLLSYISLKDVSDVIFFESWNFTGLFCSFHDNSSITSWELPEFQPCACDCKVVLNLRRFSTNQFCLTKRGGQLQGCLTLPGEMVLQICVVRWLLLKWFGNMELWRANSVFCSLWKSQKGEPRAVYRVRVCARALRPVTQGRDPWLPARGGWGCDSSLKRS